MNRLKICMVTTFYPPYNFGGDGIFVERLVNALAQDGNEVHVIHDRDAFDFCSGIPSNDRPSVVVSGNIVYHTLGTGHPDSFDMIARHQTGAPQKATAELERLLDQNFDVIHFHNVSLMGGPEVLKLGKGIKLVTLHDHWFVCSTHVLWRFDREPCTKRTCISCTIASKRPPQLWRYTGAVERAARHINAFIAPSEFARQSHLNNEFPAPIRVLPHFIPDEHLRPLVQNGRPHERPYFLFCGRLEKIKGVQVLIDLFRTFHNADLLIAGQGEYEHELKNEAVGLDHVHFLGRVPNERLRSLYKHALAVIVPSLCYETFGLVALEAFAMGTPALVNDLGALPEVVRAGGGIAYSTLAELSRAMEQVRTDPDFRERLSREAGENLRANYTQQRHLDDYYAMIAELKGSKSMQEVR